MEIITKIFNMDFGALVPELSAILEKSRLLIKVCVLIGPLILLVLGLIYLLIPPKEANYRFGFRTYFGMGSVEAWRFTQKVAGFSYTLLGLGLLIAMYLKTSEFEQADPIQMVTSALMYLLLQAGLALLARLVTGILAAIFFTSYGDRRRDRRDYY